MTARGLLASSGLHVIAIAGVAALMAAFGALLTTGGEPERVVSARLEHRAEPERAVPEPEWQLEPQPFEVSDPVPHERDLPEDEAALDEPIAETTIEVAWWNEPLELPDFHSAEPTPPSEIVDATNEPVEPPSPEDPAIAPGLPDVEPVLISAPAPVYPALAQRRGWEGVLRCTLTVDAQGRVAHAEILDSSGRDVLDDAALEAVRTWRFEPGTRNGVAETFTVRHQIRFRLRP